MPQSAITHESVFPREFTLTHESARKHVVVVYTDAGGGHRATAQALRMVLEAAGGYRVTLVNAYSEVLRHLDPYPRLTGLTIEGVYNEMVLGRGRTGLFCLGYYALCTLVATLGRRAGGRAFAALWERSAPDLVVSVLPLASLVMRDGLRTYRGGRVPLAVLMTDWDELSRHVWFPRGNDYAAICGTAESLGRVRAKGHPADRIFALDGLLVRPEFLEPLPEDLGAARVALGLEADRPTAVVMYGGHGTPRMAELAEALAAAGSRLQVVFLCGRNAELARRLEAARLPFPHRIVGWSENIRAYMAAADVFVGKTGPQSVSEALALGLPLLVDRHRVLPQERALVRWIEESGTGRVFRTPAQFVAAIEAMAARPRTPAAREAARGNGAARQIVPILETILETARQDGVSATP